MSPFNLISELVKEERKCGRDLNVLLPVSFIPPGGGPTLRRGGLSPTL